MLVAGLYKCRHVCLPGRLLLENLSLEVSFGERLLVILPASGGKSLSLGMKLKENIVNTKKYIANDDAGTKKAVS